MPLRPDGFGEGKILSVVVFVFRGQFPFFRFGDEVELQVLVIAFAFVVVVEVEDDLISFLTLAECDGHGVLIEKVIYFGSFDDGAASEFAGFEASFADEAVDGPSAGAYELTGFFDAEEVFLLDDGVEGVGLAVAVDGVKDFAVAFALFVVHFSAVVAAELGDGGFSGEFFSAVLAGFFDAYVAAHLLFFVVTCSWL